MNIENLATQAWVMTYAQVVANLASNPHVSKAIMDKEATACADLALRAVKNNYARIIKEANAVL